MHSLTMLTRACAAFLILLLNIPLVLASPVQPSSSEGVLAKRTTPNFPSDIPSCGICAGNYSSISSCAAAVPVLQNFTMVCGRPVHIAATSAEIEYFQVLFNPGAFIDVIKCACTDTFQSGMFF